MLMFQDQKDTKESWEKRGLNTKMIDVTTQILKFRDFLVHSWPDLDLLMENHDWDDDGSFTEEWLQVNWEFLVERELLEKKGFLKSYTYSDYRITSPGAIATHQIICKPNSNNPLIDDKTGDAIPTDIILKFGGFVARLNPGYGCYPPFNFVTVFANNKKQMYKLAVEHTDFFVISV